MKYIFTTLLTPLLLIASSESTLQIEIQDAIKEKKLIDEKIKFLKSKLPKKELDENYITHTEFGYSKTGGNTNTKNFNLDTEIKKRWGKHNNKLHIDAQYSQSNGKETKNKYILELEYNYDLTSRLSFDYVTGYKEDKFSSYDYQFYTGPGLYYKFIDKDKHHLNIDANILLAQDKSEDLRRYYTSFMSKSIYTWQILDNLEFEQILSYRTEIQDNKNYFVYSKSALSTKFSDMFSASLSYKYDYVNILTTKPSHKDDTFSVNLIVDY